MYSEGGRMTRNSGKFAVLTVCWSMLSVPGAFGACLLAPQSQDGAQAALVRRLGAIKAINGNTITLAPDSGADITVNIQPSAKLLRIAPGAKDLKDATPVQLRELQTGDRVRVRGQGSPDGSIAALEVIVMARTDIEARRQQDQQDWQKRGLGGIVSSVDPASNSVTISVTGFSGKKDIVIRSASNTVIRRYAPDSVKFDNAKPSTLAEIHPGDQLRARGDRSADGSSMQAEEVVTGSFRNIAGTVISFDANSGTINVQDLLTKKPVTVKVTSESQLHQLPPEFAQRIAMRLKGGMPPGTPGAAASGGAAANGGDTGPSRRPAGATGSSVGTAGTNGGGMAGGTHAGGGGFEQMLNRMPALSLADLHKGDAILVVATEGNSSASTAITLLSGVEPILQAAPSASQAMMLTPWSLGGAPAGEGLQ
jgi:uncharacterized protein DUF5666